MSDMSDMSDISNLSISVPTSSSDLWLNVDSNISRRMWYKSIFERRRKMKKMNNTKIKTTNSICSRNIFEEISHEEIDKNSEKKWRRLFFYFGENYDSDDEFSDDDYDDYDDYDD